MTPDLEALKALVELRKAELAAQTGPLPYYIEACEKFERAARNAMPSIERLLAGKQDSTRPSEPVAWILENKETGRRVLQWPEDIAPGPNKATRARMEETGWKYYPLVFAAPPV